MADSLVIDLAALRRGDPAARRQLDEAIAAAPNDRRLRIAQAEARFAVGEVEPWSELDPLLAHEPEWIEGQNVRAALRWEMGLGAAFADGFRAALVMQPRNGTLWNAYIAALSATNDPAGAADAARDAQVYFNDPILRLIEASQAGTAGDITRAERLLDALPAGFPGRAPIDARHLIRTGRLDRADAILSQLRAKDPADLTTWALTEVVWRACGNPRADWLGGQPGMIATVELALSPDRLARLADVLRVLHARGSQPVGQSVRGGTQTRGPLFERQEPEIAAFRDIVQEAIEAYVRSLPPQDDTHPLLRHRYRQLVAQGGWSVRLQSAGHHVPHLHPSGVVSSAAYIVLPGLDAGSQEGWLELGVPPADLCLDLSARAAVEPRPGRLVLFPSFLYHGTRPFNDGERLSVAFDAIAAPVRLSAGQSPGYVRAFARSVRGH